MKLMRRIITLALALASCILSACGANNQPQVTQQPQTVAQQPIQQQPIQQQPIQQQPIQQQPIQQQPNYGYVQPTMNISLDQAKEIATNHAGYTSANVTFVKAQQDYDDGFINWDIDFVVGSNKYEYEVSAIDGRIIKSEIKMINNGYIPQQPIMQNGAMGAVQGQGIDVETAKSIAVTSAGFAVNNVVFTKTKYDFDDGMAKWEIEFVANTNKYEFDISAANGAVIKSKVETIYN